MRDYTLGNFVHIAIFFAVVNALIFVSTGVFHEVGHGIMGIIHGCWNIRIIALDFATGGTYTLMSCPSAIPPYLSYLSAYFVVLPVSALLLLLEGFDVRYMGTIMLGGTVLSSASDLMKIYPQDYLYYIVAGIGALIILFGEDELAEYIVRKKTPDIVGKYNRQVLDEGEDEETKEESEDQGSESENDESADEDTKDDSDTETESDKDEE